MSFPYKLNLKCDKRPYSKKLVINTTAKVPDIIDLRPKCPPIYDQKTLGSCTANGAVAAYQFDKPEFYGSRLFLYYCERQADGDVETDGGSTVTQAMNCLGEKGLCSEEDWPYDVEKFATKPLKKCFIDAKQHKASNFYSLYPSHENLQKALHVNQKPIVFGMAVYPSFMTEEVAKTGIVPMPSEDEQIVGFHCVNLCGVDRNKKHYIVRNSWGEKWGDKGYFYLPIEYVEDVNICSDFWQLLTVEEPEKLHFEYYKKQPQPEPKNNEVLKSSWMPWFT